MRDTPSHRVEHLCEVILKSRLIKVTICVKLFLNPPSMAQLWPGLEMRRTDRRTRLNLYAPNEGGGVHKQSNQLKMIACGSRVHTQRTVLFI